MRSLLPNRKEQQKEVEVRAGEGGGRKLSLFPSFFSSFFFPSCERRPAKHYLQLVLFQKGAAALRIDE